MNIQSMKFKQFIIMDQDFTEEVSTTQKFKHRGNLTTEWICSKETPEITTIHIINDNHDIFTIIDRNITKELQNFTWCPLKTNKSKKVYVRTNHQNHNYLHEYVLYLNNIEKPTDGKEYSVDHINRDTLDNRLENLRWATQSEQNINTDKRTRKHNARELPEGILEEYIPKYVTYNKEVYNKEKNLTREFFRIEKHPNIENWTSSKSEKMSILEKLAQTYNKLNMELPGEINHIHLHDIDTLHKCTIDDFVLQKNMLPRYVNFCKETDKRGCKFEIAIPNKKRVCTSGSKKVSLKAKYNEMLNLLESTQNN